MCSLRHVIRTGRFSAAATAGVPQRVSVDPAPVEVCASATGRGSAHASIRSATASIRRMSISSSSTARPRLPPPEGFRRQVALAWLLHKPGVTAPIVGATKPEHLDDAIAAEKLSLDAEEIARLEERYIPHAVSKHSGVRERITVDQPTAALPRPLSERSS